MSFKRWGATGVALRKMSNPSTRRTSRSVANLQAQTHFGSEDRSGIANPHGHGPWRLRWHCLGLALALALSLALPLPWRCRWRWDGLRGGALALAQLRRR